MVDQEVARHGPSSETAVRVLQFRAYLLDYKLRERQVTARI
jgi:hypothetical protein